MGRTGASRHSHASPLSCGSSPFIFWLVMRNWFYHFYKLLMAVPLILLPQHKAPAICRCLCHPSSRTSMRLIMVTLLWSWLRPTLIPRCGGQEKLFYTQLQSSILTDLLKPQCLSASGWVLSCSRAAAGSTVLSAWRLPTFATMLSWAQFSYV